LSTGDDLAGGTWTVTGSLNAARETHTATLLPSGRVLVAGGFDSTFNAFASAERYDPASRTWTATGNLNSARAYHTATLLPNGTVLVTGGQDGPTFTPSGVLSSAELYDSATGSWTVTGRLNTARYIHTASLLSNGMVLVAGGISGFNAFSSAELYDPASGTWTLTGSLNTARFRHTATLMPNGMVLVAAGESSKKASFPVQPDHAPSWLLGVPDAGCCFIFPVASAELYDPASGTWTVTGSLNTARHAHTATLLSNGMVLVAGGLDSDLNALASAELYDPASETWTLTGNLNTARYIHTATLLPNGMVLVAGGYSDLNPLDTAELYDPASGTWIVTDSLNTARYYHTATLLSDGMVLVAGGLECCFPVSASAELYAAGPTPTPTPTPTPCSVRCSPTPRPRPTLPPHVGYCFFDRPNCSGVPNLAGITCVECLTAHPGGSWQDTAACHTTCPLR
jgi:N-acetylneuraminic acid mutarotase